MSTKNDIHWTHPSACPHLAIFFAGVWLQWSTKASNAGLIVSGGKPAKANEIERNKAVCHLTEGVGV